MADNPKDEHRLHVKFISDSNHNFRSIFRNEITIGTLKKNLSDISDVDVMGIKFKFKGKDLEDSRSLVELVERPFVPVEIELDFINSKLGKKNLKENLPSIDVITVHPQSNKIEDITVVIEDHSIQKQWEGGYRNKLDGKEYHHAIAQTSPSYTRVTDKPKPMRFHRDTQTCHLKTAGTTITKSKATQMWRGDCYVAADNDKIIEAKPYIMYKKGNVEQKDEKARVIQKFWRNYRFQKNFQSRILNAVQKNEEKNLRIEEISMAHALEERKIITGAAFPSRRDDFHLLHLVLGQWLKKIWRSEKDLRGDLSRKAKLYIVLTKEIDCLSAIEKHKINQKKEAFKRDQIRLLEITSRPKFFKNKSGKLISMIDIETQRARELKEIHSELINREAKDTDRINFLNTFKHFFTTNFSTYEFASDIVSLVDREIHLIIIGMKNKDLKGVRMRIEQLFLHFVRQKEFNPKAAKYKKMNLPHMVLQEYLCVRCRKQLPASDFPVHFRMKDYSVCTSCQWMYDIGLLHFDLAPYKKLLTEVRKEEMDVCSKSAICFLLQPPGMAYLTKVIWHNRSIISENRIMRGLCHVRWLRDVEWSPWNTILLTAEEAEFHCSIPDVNRFYDRSFVMSVHNRHIMARNHFRDLEKANQSLCSSRDWLYPEQSDFYTQKDSSEDFITEDDFDTI